MNTALVTVAQKLFDYHNRYVTRQPELIATLDSIAQDHNAKIRQIVDYLGLRIDDHVTDDGTPKYPETEAMLVSAICEFHEFIVNEQILWTEDVIEIRKNAAAMMGKSTSDAKAAAARANGKRGGRPRKQTE